MGRDPNRIRLAIVDDHPIVRQGIIALLQLQEDLEVLGEASDADEAMSLLDSIDVDLIVVDLSLRGRSGLDLVRQIREVHGGLPILVLSMHDELFYAERALRAGANGYIMKQEAVDRIQHAIRQVMQGEIYVSESVANKMLHEFMSGELPSTGSLAERLSDRELEVFRLIGQGYGTRQIADLLGISIKTVESYRANIKEKMQLGSAHELVKHAIEWVHTTSPSR